MKYIWGPRKWHVSFTCESFEGRCSHLSVQPSAERHFRCLYLEDQSPVLRPAADGRLSEELTKSWAPVEGLDKCSHDPALRLPGEWVHSESPRAGSGPAGRGQGCAPPVLLTSSLAPFLKSALERKGPLGACCFYSFRTRASEKGPSTKKKANKVRIKENKQLEGRHYLRFLILKFLYFPFDFLRELWRHVSQADSVLEEEYKGEGGRAGRHVEKKKKTTRPRPKKMH